jgi:hypothetical protein
MAGSSLRRLMPQSLPISTSANHPQPHQVEPQVASVDGGPTIAGRQAAGTIADQTHHRDVTLCHCGPTRSQSRDGSLQPSVCAALDAKTTTGRISQPKQGRTRASEVVTAPAASASIDGRHTIFMELFH